MGKLPYIPDKKLYAAVMGACSYVRDTGYFNKATSYYANKYNVDVEEVRRYVRIAQGNGQKKRQREKSGNTNGMWLLFLEIGIVLEIAVNMNLGTGTSRQNGNTPHG